MSFSPGRRIEFEREVLSSGAPLIRRVNRRSPGRLIRITAVIALLGGLTAVAGAFAVRSGFFNSERRGITRMSKTFIEGLAQPDPVGALDVCAEGPKTSERVLAEERSVFGDGVSNPAGGAEKQLAALRDLRSELEEEGVTWSNAIPFAFGGVRARVEGGAMKQPLTVLSGEIYFKSAGRVFAIEVSAWRCDGQFIIVDVWKGFAMSDSVTDLAAYSAEQAAQLQQQTSEGGALTVSYPKQVYVEF